MLKHLISISVLVVVASGACFDNGDKEIGGTCYKFVSQQLSFNDARDWCHYQNPVTASYLAYVPNQFTANFLASYARSAFGQNDGFFWIGLSRTKNYNPWTWDTGFKAAFTNFNGDQLSQNNAAESIVNTKWRTFGEEEKMNFVCSYDPTAPPTFAPQTSPLPTTTPQPITARVSTPSVPTTTEFDYDDFCNVGEKHSTFLLAYATDFDTATFNTMVNSYIIPAISNDRHNYTKLARARLDTKTPEAISYLDDVASFQTELLNNPPTPGLAAEPALPSNFLTIISSFLNATGRPLESSMIILLVSRFPQIGIDLTQEEYDKITLNNVKIFPMITYESYNRENATSSRSYKPLSNLAANSNGNFAIGTAPELSELCISSIMNTAYTKSLAFSRNFDRSSSLMTMKVPRSRLGHVEYTATMFFEKPTGTATANSDIVLIFLQDGQANHTFVWELNNLSTNMYNASMTLVPNLDCFVLVVLETEYSQLALRVWTESTAYHYGSYAAIDDPMGGNPLAFVEEFQGAALRMRIMNDCYTDYSGSIVITDCNGVVSAKYDSIQSIPTDYIFADEGSFPHYPFVPFFCDSVPKNSNQCVPGTESKYDIQFVAGEFTVTRSFQCRPGVGKANPKCQNVDANGNLYCDRDQVPYVRGPTGQLIDCLGHGHVEFDFFDTETYICVCDNGYSGASCEQKA